jgi:5'-nucleotidase
MKSILVTNDDGYTSAGFIPLVKQLSQDFKITIVVPSREKSWIGKAITTKKELSIDEINYEGFTLFTVDGAPADCVQLGMYNVMQNKPDMVVSGINQGENAGHARILSSGTVGAAVEAAFEKIPALASSIAIPLAVKEKTDLFDKKNYYMFENAANITRKIVNILEGKKFEAADLFSVNIPYDATSTTAYMITKPFKDPYGQLFHKTKGGYLHETPPLDYNLSREGTDLDALSKKKISITPLCLDLFSKKSVQNIEQLFQNKW